MGVKQVGMIKHCNYKDPKDPVCSKATGAGLCL